VTTFVDQTARFEAEELGDGSRVLAFARVGPRVTIGRDCVVHDHTVLLGPMAQIIYKTVQEAPEHKVKLIYCALPTKRRRVLRAFQGKARVAGVCASDRRDGSGLLQGARADRDAGQ